MENQIIKFDSFTLDLSENILLKNNRPIKITKKAFQMLVYLANRPNELIPSEALLKEIWSEGSANLSRLLVNVTTIRNILGKKEDGTDYILNQPKKGYIFNCYVIKNNSSQNQLKEIQSQDNLSFNNFIGRTQELETLKLEVENLLKNVGNAVLIQGEIGIGKTTFIQKFIEATNKPRVFVKRFFHFVADKTPEYEVFFKLIWEIIRQDDLNYSYQKLVVKLKEKYNISFPYKNDDQIPNSFETNPIGADFWVRQIIKCFLEIAKNEPLVLIFDDVHFAEIADLEVLENLINLSKENQVLLILSARFANESGVSPCYPKWIKSQYSINRLREIKLKLLGKSECVSLIERIFGSRESIPEIPSEDLKAFLLLTKGNPYFLVEMVRWLIREKQIYLTAENGTKWQWQKTEEFSFPDSLSELVKFKLENILPETNEILHKIAVYGDSFNIQEIREIFSVDEKKLEQAIKESVSNGIITENRNDDKEYRFTHFIQRKIIYDSVEKFQKKQLHQKIANYLTTKYQNNDDVETLIKISRHYEMSGDEENSCFWHYRTGEVLAKNNKWKEAFLYLEKINSEKFLKQFSDENLCKYYLLRAECLHNLDNISELLINAEKLEQVAASVSNKEFLIKSFYLKARVMIITSKYDEAFKYLDKALKYSQQFNQSELTNEILYIKVTLLFTKGKYHEIIKVKENVGLHNIPKTLSEALIDISIAISHCFLGNTTKSGDILKSVLIFADSTNNPRIKFKATFCLGHVYFQEGRYEKVIELIEELKKELADKFEAKHSITHADFLVATSVTLQGFFEKGIEMLLNSVKAFEEFGVTHSIAIAYRRLGFAYCETRNLIKARKYLSKSLKTLTEIDDKDEMAMNLIETARVNYADKDFEAMLKNATQAFKYGSEIKNKRCVGLALAEIALALAEMKQHQIAIQKAKEAVEILGESTLIERWRVYFALGKVIMINQRHKPVNDAKLLKQAENAYIEAVETLDDIRAELDLDKSGNLMRFTEITKAYSAPAIELHKLWIKTGETKKARLLAQEWFLKVRI